MSVKEATSEIRDAKEFSPEIGWVSRSPMEGQRYFVGSCVPQPRPPGGPCVGRPCRVQELAARRIAK